MEEPDYPDDPIFQCVFIGLCRIELDDNHSDKIRSLACRKHSRKIMYDVGRNAISATRSGEQTR